MHDVRLARLRLLLVASLSFGASAASVGGTYAAITAALPVPAAAPMTR